jgi:hypothetical protein
MSQKDREEVQNNLPLTAKMGVYLTKEYGTLAVVFMMLAFFAWTVYIQNERMYEISLSYAVKNTEFENSIRVLTENSRITNELLREIKGNQK